MRDLVFKNLTSDDKKKKILASYETSEDEGIRSIITRHFVYLIREAAEQEAERPQPQPYLYILKEHNKREQREKFLCKIKGSVYAACGNKVYQIFFIHSLRINLSAKSQNVL